MKCNICDSDREVKHLSIYAFGSEGVYICIGCQAFLSEHLRRMRELAGRVKIEFVKSYSKESK